MKNRTIYVQTTYINSGLAENEQLSHQHTLEAFLKDKGGHHISHLIFLKDKHEFWTKNRHVLIVYKQISNKIVVLGDPIGEEAHIQLAIREFQDFCKAKKCVPVFYQVSPKYMPFYEEMGFRFVKLGEEAVVNLTQFSLEGKKGAKLRTRVNKLLRNGYTFSVIEPPHAHEVIVKLKAISDSWLGNSKEKGFSVVSFREDYVSRFPIALLQDADEKIIAFATLPPDYKKTIIIDLMRKIENSPHGTMDMLFIKIFEWAKERGFEHCSLGMAPLSNVGCDKNALLSEKMMHLVYLYGNNKYNFKGLKEFKHKFSPQWEPKYLAYKKSFLALLFWQLVSLINKSGSVNSQEVTGESRGRFSRLIRKHSF